MSKIPRAKSQEMERLAIEMYSANPNLTAKSIGEALGIHISTAARYIKWVRKFNTSSKSQHKG